MSETMTRRETDFAASVRRWEARQRVLEQVARRLEREIAGLAVAVRELGRALEEAGDAAAAGGRGGKNPHDGTDAMCSAPPSLAHSRVSAPDGGAAPPGEGVPDG